MGVHTWFYRKGFNPVDKLLSNPLRRRINGKWYIEDTHRPHPILIKYPSVVFYVEYYHDLFRAKKDTDTKLFSLEETKKFIANENITDVKWEDLEEFWMKYPDGMILFS